MSRLRESIEAAIIRAERHGWTAERRYGGVVWLRRGHHTVSLRQYWPQRVPAAETAGTP